MAVDETKPPASAGGEAGDDAGADNGERFLYCCAGRGFQWVFHCTLTPEKSGIACAQPAAQLRQLRMLVAFLQDKIWSGKCLMGQNTWTWRSLWRPPDGYMYVYPTIA